MPGLSDSQKTDLVKKVVDEIGWGDVTSASSKFGTDFQPPKPGDVQNLTLDQKKVIQDFIGRTNIDQAIKDRINDLLNPPKTDEPKPCP